MLVSNSHRAGVFYAFEVQPASLAVLSVSRVLSRKRSEVGLSVVATGRNILRLSSNISSDV